MAEMSTDAAALSAAAVEFDGIRSFFLFEDSASESRTGMQDTEKGVTGMFASAGDEGGQAAQKLGSIWGGSGSEAYQAVQQRWDSSEAATNFDGISGDLKSAIGQVDAEAANKQIQELNTISENINRSGTPYQSAADDAASSLQGSMGFTPPDDGFDFKAMEAGEASCSLKYNFGGIDGAASAVHRSFDGDDLATYQPDTHDGGAGGLLFGSGGDGGIPATMAEWALLLA